MVIYFPDFLKTLLEKRKLNLVLILKVFETYISNLNQKH